MVTPKIHTIEVWAQLFLCHEDCARIGDFFVSEFGVARSMVVRRMHITVYHARRPMLGVSSVSETARMVLPTTDTRFMVLAPGGENPRPELEPGNRMVGIRVHRQSAALGAILKFRDRLLQHETGSVLGIRAPSTRNKNAFGARHFQPHMAVLRAGSGIDRDLTLVGFAFRQALGDLTFDRFVTDVVKRTAERTSGRKRA